MVKHQTITPLILANGNQDVILFCGRHMVCQRPSEDLMMIFIAYLGLYYMLDVDYPGSHELSFTVMQYILFKDKKTPPDLVKAVDAVWGDYCKFKGAK